MLFNMEDWKYDYYIEQLHKTAYKKHECFVISYLIHSKELADLKPCTQYYIKKNEGGYALIDLFFPQLQLAIEIDEPHHQKNSQLDYMREKDVEKSLNCEFIRIKIDEGRIVEQVKNLRKLIIDKYEKLLNDSDFKEWLEPKKMDLHKAKNEFNKTLFIKIRGDIKPENLRERQTGFWRIDKIKQNKIEQIIVVHNGVVSRIFKEINWRIWDKNPSKVGYTAGRESDTDPLVGTIIENWTTQQTITYSNDLY